MFDELGEAGTAADPVETAFVIPDEAWAMAPCDGPDGMPEPQWGLYDGRPVVRADAPAPADAWEQAADFVQARLDAIEVEHRRIEVARVEALVVACRASLKDLEVRFGLSAAQTEQQGMRSFAQQTGLSLGVSPNRVLHLLDIAQRGARLLPSTWAVFTTLACTWRAVELAVDELEGLPAELVAAFDAEAARLVATAPMTRLAARLRKARERLQDDTADARAKTTEQQRTARLRLGRDGSASFTFRGPAADWVAFDTAVTKAAVAAKTDDETRTITQLRYDIGRDLLIEGLKTAADPDNTGLTVPARKGVDVIAAVTVPALAWLGVTNEQATLEGVGPIALSTALRLAAGAMSLVRILTDPVTGVRVALDRTVYRPPADLARWVAYRDQRCRFPGCNRRAAGCDVDHAHEWQDLGVTNDDNLVTLCRPTHVMKTMKLWQEELQADGDVDWVSPWGRRYTDPPPDPADPAPRHLYPDECPF